MRRLIVVEEVNCQVGQLVYDARTSAALTQGQLARKIGTTQSVISRIEDADYYGHSLQMLRRVADALDLKLDVRFLPRVKSRRTAVR
jgi:ribosome-binding protein aMBF1 (putative translation factor)